VRLAAMRYALFQHSLDELDAEAVGDALDAAEPRLARADARMLVRRAYGVLFEGLTEPHARALAQALAARGVAVERVEQAWLELPPATVCRRADIEPRGLVIYDLYGRVTELPWSRVLLVAVGSYPVPERVPQTRTSYEGAPGLLTGHRETVFVQPSYEYVDQAQVVLDVVVAGAAGGTGGTGAARYRIQRQRFDYSYLGARLGPSATANFPLLVRDLLERVPHALHNQGLRLGRGDAGDMLSYPGPTQYEREIAWSLWRFLGPGTRLDGGDPYRASGAAGPRLMAPLMRSASAAPGGTRSAGSSGGAALVEPGSDAVTRAGEAGPRGRLVDAGLAALGGAAVGVAGWWVDPLAALLALPVMRVVFGRLHRRRLRRLGGDDAAVNPDAPA
jgi:hypothetical protein